MASKGFSKAKGSDWERACCKKISLWLSHGKHDDWLWRSAMSGGRASVLFKRGKVNRTQQGDLTAIDPGAAWFLNLFTVECKFVKDLYLTLFLTKGSGELAKYWDELLLVCRRTKRQPFMCARENHTIPFIIVREPTPIKLPSKARLFSKSTVVFYDFEKVLQEPIDDSRTPKMVEDSNTRVEVKPR